MVKKKTYAALAMATLLMSCGHQPNTGQFVCGFDPTKRPETATQKSPIKHTHPAQILSRKALLADLDQLLSYLKRAHPDPYLGGGGRSAFHERASRIRAAIPAGGLTQEGFFRLVAPLVASVQDGHTSIRLPQPRPSEKGKRERAWIDFDVAGNTIFVSKAYGPRGKELLGRQVVGIGGVDVRTLTERMKLLRGADNSVQNLVHLMGVTKRIEWLPLLLNSPRGSKTLRLSLRGSNPSQIAAVDVPIGHNAPGTSVRLPASLSLPSLNAADMGWGFADREQTVALLRFRSMRSYREAFEMLRGLRALSNYRRRHLTDVLKAAIGDDGAAKLNTLDKKIAAIPSAAELLTELVKSMQKRGTKKLIVDLRDNGGGNSFIVQILQVALFGPKAVEASQRGYQIPRLSKLYFENYKVDPSAELQRRGLSQYGDYDFSGSPDVCVGHADSVLTIG